MSTVRFQSASGEWYATPDEAGEIRAVEVNGKLFVLQAVGAHAQEIKDIRNALGLTQTQFANLLGVAFASVNRWEKGRFDPTDEKLTEMRGLKKI